VYDFNVEPVLGNLSRIIFTAPLRPQEGDPLSTTKIRCRKPMIPVWSKPKCHDWKRLWDNIDNEKLADDAGAHAAEITRMSGG
jgi:hypothetical protein